jgi:ABC-type ATPase with predicted acetyltransferase domain
MASAGATGDCIERKELADATPAPICTRAPTGRRMRKIDLLVETKLTARRASSSCRACSTCRRSEKLSHHWKGEIDIDEKPWNVGLIVGPSGAGKSSVARSCSARSASTTWKAASVIDDFDKKFSIEQVAEICSAVGFNTIPSWMKPYGVLSTGEKFRVDLARHVLEGGDLVMVDEFTSVIDRQVANIGCHAVQKLIRKQQETIRRRHVSL